MFHSLVRLFNLICYYIMLQLQTIMYKYTNIWWMNICFITNGVIWKKWKLSHTSRKKNEFSCKCFRVENCQQLSTCLHAIRLMKHILQANITQYRNSIFKKYVSCSKCLAKETNKAHHLSQCLVHPMLHQILLNW